MNFNKNELAIVILAAGKGTRMKSSLPKVLHEIDGRPMIWYVIEAARKIAENNIVVVVGDQAEVVQEAVKKRKESVRFALQKRQLGTGHAVKCARDQLEDTIRHVLILCGDVPMITSSTLEKFVSQHIENDRDISLLAGRKNKPGGYGRVILGDNIELKRIVEHADASEAEKEIDLVNTGIFCVKKDFLYASLEKLNTDNKQAELYLTDIVEIGNRENKQTGVMIREDFTEFLGINDKNDLKNVENIIKNRIETSNIPNTS